MGIRRDLLMHGLIAAMAGFPMLSSGDEIGQLNGYGYHDDPFLREDSRNLHRTPFSWENAAKGGLDLPGKVEKAGEGFPAPAAHQGQQTVQQRIWDGLGQLEELRARQPLLGPEASVSTWDTHNPHVLALVRRRGRETLTCLFN